MKRCGAALLISMCIAATACNDSTSRDEVSSVSELQPTIQLRKEGCTPLSTDYQSPEVGASFEYRYQNGMRIVRVITAVDGSQVNYTLHVIQTPQGNKPSISESKIYRETLGVIFPVIKRTDRIVAYDEDPFHALLMMNVDDLKIIKGVNSSREIRPTEAVQTRTEIDYLGCGNLNSTNGPRLVRAYKIVSQVLINLNGIISKHKTNTSTYYIDSISGMPLIIDSKTPSYLVSIDNG